MNTFSSGHTRRKRKGDNRQIISLTSLILLLSGLAALTYLLSASHLPGHSRPSPFRSVSARERIRGEEISDAVPLSEGKIHRISLAPCQHRYYYIPLKQDCTVKFLSGSSRVNADFFSQKGSRLTVTRRANRCQLKGAWGNRVFLKLTNKRTISCTVRVRWDNTTKLTTSSPGKNLSKKTGKTSRTSNKTSQKSSKSPRKSSKTPHSRQTAPKPSKTPRPRQTAPHKPSGAPHFIRLACGASKSLGIETSLKSCICSDTSVLSVKNTAIIGKKPGTAILYFREKNSTHCGSFLIRII